MLFFKKKIKKTFIWFWCAFLIAALWYIEKTKQIPQYGMVFYEMGLSCGKKCDHNKRLQYYQKAVYYNPELSDAYYRSALIYEEMGNYVESLILFKKMLELNQESFLAYYKIGLHYFREGDYERALKYFFQCDKLSSSPNEKYYYLAQIYDQRKEYNFAVGYYIDVIFVQPELFDQAYSRLTKIYHLIKDDDAAVHEMRLRKLGRNNLADHLEHCRKAAQGCETSGKK